MRGRAVTGPGAPPGDGDGWRPVPDPTTLTTAQLLRELGALRELVFTRLDGMDKATALLSETVNRTPAVIQTEIRHVRELVDGRFASVALQFTERDTRAGQAAAAAAAALSAALQAAKELVTQQNEANRGEAAKTEQAFTKQIDGQASRIDELKERIDRGEGSTSGAAGTRSEQRLNVSQLVAVAAVLVAAATLILLALKK
jgi:hypothetical protein